MATYLGIDLTNWIHTIWHANSGHDVLKTVCRRIEALTNQLQPKLVVACFDHHSFRHELYPPYKAKRGDKPEGLIDDLRAGPDIVTKYAVVVRAHGFEADDCLAALALSAVNAGSSAVIASPDKDLRQSLVTGRVSIIRNFNLMGHIATNIDWMTQEELLIQHGLTPTQWIDYQTLAGDTGDGVPGCPGWGEKTAKAAITQFGTLDAIYDRIDELKVSAARKTSLLAFRSHDLAIMRQLVTLRTDVEDIRKLFITRRRVGAA